MRLPGSDVVRPAVTARAVNLDNSHTILMHTFLQGLPVIMRNLTQLKVAMLDCGRD